MAKSASYDAIIVGSGPNGLSAAIRLAQNGLSVLVLEANETAGGGARSLELTRPGFVHDICSAIHPMAMASPFFRQLNLPNHGLSWVHPGVPLAHPLDGGQAVLLDRSIASTGRGLGPDDRSYVRLMSPLVEQWETFASEFLQPILHLPRHPLLLARFGWQGLRSAVGLAKSCFAGPAAQALFAGLAAHSFLPLEQAGSSSFGLVLGMMGHAVGWPLARGGTQQIANALAAHLHDLGGEIRTACRVDRLDELPKARAILLDLTPRQVLGLARGRLPRGYRRRLEAYRYGPGIFKIDYALHGPIPWQAQDCSRAGTVHVGGSLEEIAASERQVGAGEHPARPFVLLAQQSLFDETRAPSGKHTVWAYCHVPNGSQVDRTEAIESQIERFAPGFKDQVLERHSSNCAQLEMRNANLIGGDISGGAMDLAQLIARPVLRPNPYRIPAPGLYLCSASTPPGSGVHGMCGFQAAETAIRDCFS